MNDTMRIIEKKKNKSTLSSPLAKTCSRGENQFLEKESVTLSRFPGYRTVGSRRSKKQSCSTRQELRVGIDFVEFQQLQEVGIFSYLVYSLAKSHFNGWGFVEA